VKHDVSLVQSFLNYITEKRCFITSDVLNEYLLEKYKDKTSSRKRVGNEIVRFSVQALGMKQG